MPSPILHPSQTTIEEKLAKLCVRPHLSSDVLPRFVLAMLEAALHSFLCSFAACVMEIIEKYRRGELEPWPEDAPDAADAPRTSRYQMTSPPAAPRRRAGATPVHSVPAAAPVDEAADGLTARAPVVAGGQTGVAGWSAWPRRRAVPGLRPMVRLASAGDWPARDRCRPGMFCGAAGMRRETCV